MRWIAIALAWLVGSATVVQADMLLYDGVENGIDPAWDTWSASGETHNEVGPGFDLTATADCAQVGDLGLFALRVESHPIDLLERAFPPANHLVRAQFWVRPNPTDPDHGQHFWLGYGAAHVQETLSTNLGCGFLADGSIIARSDGYPVIGAFQHDAWYRVQLSANIPDQTFSIRVEDASGFPIVQENDLPWERSGPEFTSLGYFTAAADGQLPGSFCLDEVIVSTPYDGFENGVDESWYTWSASGVTDNVVGPGFDLGATEDCAVNGDFGLRAERVENLPSDLLERAFPTVTDRVRVQFWVRPNPIVADHGQIFYVGYGPAIELEGESTNLGIHFEDDGRILARSPGYPQIGEFVHDQWYEVTIEADVPSQTFDLFVEDEFGELVTSELGLTWEREGAQFTSLGYFTASQGGPLPGAFCLDDFRVSIPEDEDCYSEKRFESIEELLSIYAWSATGETHNVVGDGPVMSIEPFACHTGGQFGLNVVRDSVGASGFVEWPFGIAEDLLEVTFWVKPNPNPQPNHSQIFYLGYGSARVLESESTNIGVHFNGDGRILARTGGYPEVGTFVLNSWYCVTLTADVPNQTFGFTVKDPGGAIVADVADLPWERDGDIFTYLKYFTVGISGSAPSSFCLDDVCVNGEPIVSVGETASLVEPVALRVVGPNPTSGGTHIRFAVDQSTSVRLAMYDVSGRLVAPLLTGRVESGEHQASWDGRVASGARAAAGIYFLRLETERGSVASKIVVNH